MEGAAWRRRDGRSSWSTPTWSTTKYDEEFNAWYDTEHLPQLLKLPGFLDAARYVAVKGGPKYLAAYELESVEAVQTPEFLNRHDPALGPADVAAGDRQELHPDPRRADLPGRAVERADRGMAPALQIGRMSVPESVDAEWNAWYNGEYIPGYRKVPGVIYARRYRVVEGNVGYTTVYEFENEKVPESAEWKYQQRHSSPNSGGCATP